MGKSGVHRFAMHAGIQAVVDEATSPGSIQSEGFRSLVRYQPANSNASYALTARSKIQRERLDDDRWNI